MVIEELKTLTQVSQDLDIPPKTPHSQLSIFVGADQNPSHREKLFFRNNSHSAIALKIANTS